MITRAGWCAALLFLGVAAVVPAQVTREELDRLLDSRVYHWRWRLGETPGAERAEFDDSEWQAAGLGFQWYPHDSTGWFRTRITVPEQVNGIPTRGGAVRMQVGVDNAARAYVNGEFRQEFERANGDFVLTENAQPGEVITVALQAVNRAGFGRLYEARLLCGAGEGAVNALRALVGDLDIALQDGAYVPPPEAAHWQALVREAMQALDMTAYRAGHTEAFLASADTARTPRPLPAAMKKSRRPATPLCSALSAVSPRAPASFPPPRPATSPSSWVSPRSAPSRSSLTAPA